MLREQSCPAGTHFSELVPSEPVIGACHAARVLSSPVESRPVSVLQTGRGRGGQAARFFPLRRGVVVGLLYLVVQLAQTPASLAQIAPAGEGRSRETEQKAPASGPPKPRRLWEPLAEHLALQVSPGATGAPPTSADPGTDKRIY